MKDWSGSASLELGRDLTGIRNTVTQIPRLLWDIVRNLACTFSLASL